MPHTLTELDVLTLPLNMSLVRQHAVFLKLHHDTATKQKKKKFLYIPEFQVQRKAMQPQTRLGMYTRYSVSLAMVKNKEDGTDAHKLSGL